MNMNYLNLEVAIKQYLEDLITEAKKLETYCDHMMPETSSAVRRKILSTLENLFGDFKEVAKFLKEHIEKQPYLE